MATLRLCIAMAGKFLYILTIHINDCWKKVGNTGILDT